MSKELDDELLDLLEAPKQTVKKKKRKQQKESSDESSDDFQVDTHEDEDEEEEEFTEFEDEDEPDISQLAAMTELEREAFLSERAEKRQRQLERREIKRRLKASEGSKRSSSGNQRQKHKKNLEELVKRKKRKSNKDEEDEYLEVEEDDDVDYSDKLRKALFNTDSHGSTAHTLTRDDIVLVQITRENLLRWMFAPFFEEAVKGCYVRLGLGKDQRSNQTVYRLCQIVGVTEYHRMYRIQAGVHAKKALILKHGKSQKEFLFDVVSNQDITENEFQRWVKTMENEKERMPSFHEITRLKKGVEEAKNHVFTNEEIHVMVEEKQRLVPVHKNLAIEKLKLLAQKEEAETQGRLEDATRIQEDIDHINELEVEHAPDDTKGEVWQQLNERNRKKNLEEGRDSELKLREERISRQKNGKSHDPFARIKAIPAALARTDDKDSDGKSTPASGSGGPVSPVGTGEAVNGGGVRKKSLVGDAFDEVFADVDIDI